MVERHTGIPTTYNFQRFRSRIEARWAAFFDKMNWPWEYEPIDLAGYIPDFILKFPKPILVEVKSELDVDKLGAYAEKIVASGWEREYLVVGATLFDAPAGYLRDFDFAQVSLGTIGIKGEDSGPAALHICRRTNKYTITNPWHDHLCRRCGNHQDFEDLMSVTRASADALWRTASNLAQWKRT